MKWSIIILALFVSLGAVGAWSYISTGMPVDVVEVRRGEVHRYVEERGKTHLPHVYRITMPQPGRIDEIELEPGDSVEKDQVVARLNARDMELELEKARSEVGRLQASIKENDDTSLEAISLKQAINLLASMRETVAAAAARVTAGKARQEYAVKNRERIETLVERQARSQDDLDQALVSETESTVDYQQDRLVHSAMQSLEAVTALLPPLVTKQMERKQLSRDVLEAQLQAAEAALAEMKINQQRSEMKSPVDGVVLRRHLRGPTYVTPGTDLLEIGRIGDMEILVDVLSQDAAAVHPGQQVEIRGPAGSEYISRGKVKRVEPAGFTKVSSLGVEQQRVPVVITIDEQDRERFEGVDYRVWVRIIIDQSSGSLRIPRSALFRSGEGHWQVYLVRDGKAELQNVELGLLNDSFAEVVSGLSEGDQVVLSPPTELEAGGRVRAETRK